MFEYLRERFPRAGIAAVERAGDIVTVSLQKFFLVAGRDGEHVPALEQELGERFGGPLTLRFVEIRRPELSPVLAADHVAGSIERGTPVARIAEVQAEISTRAGARGCRVEVTGAVTHTAERGTIDAATALTFERDGEMHPPLEADENGYPIEPPPSSEPLPRFKVRVTLSLSS